jgi:hypothetical protein
MTHDPLTTGQQKALILSILVDMGADDLCDYLHHAGFDLMAITSAKELPQAWVAHYRQGQGSYDVERAAMDLLTWPPIARRVFGLQAEAQRLAT